MNTKIILGFIFLFFSSFNLIDGDKIIGTYWSPDKDGKIAIYKKNGKYFGKSVESQTPEMKDTKNPDSALRNRIVLGQDVFFNFLYIESDDEYINGTIYNPLDGKTYKAKMWLENGNLKLHGYVGISILGITKTLERVK